MDVTKLNPSIFSKWVLGVVTRLMQPLLSNPQPHLPVAFPFSTNEALTTESQRVTATSVQEDMPAHTESVQRLTR
jgi:hypothetical protein